HLGPLRGTQPALAHDELVRVAAELANDDGLHEAELADRVLELAQRVLVEDLPRLLRVRLDRVGRDLAVDSSGHRTARRLGCAAAHRPGGTRRQLHRAVAGPSRALRNQCGEAAAQPTLSLTHALLLLVVPALGHLARRVEVTHRATRAGVVCEHRLPEAGRLG